MPKASSRPPRSSSRLADFWLGNHRRCNYGISRPFTTSRASGPQPLSFRCRRICSLISPHDRTGRSDFDQNDFDHGWNGAPLRTRTLTLRLLKYLYNFSSACVGLLPPMMTYILWQDYDAA